MADPIHPSTSGFPFSPDQSRARFPGLEPGKGDIQGGARSSVGLAADDRQHPHKKRHTMVDRVPNGLMYSTKHARFLAHLVEQVPLEIGADRKTVLKIAARATSCAETHCIVACPSPGTMIGRPSRRRSKKNASRSKALCGP